MSGEAVVSAFAASRPDFTLEESERILPGAHEEAGGADAFYLARFRRN